MDKINGYSRQEAMERAFKVGFEGEKSRHSCSQCTYNAISDVLGIRNESLFRAVHALEAGGGATTKNACGSFAAGLVVIGYFFGRPYDCFQGAKEWDVKADMLGYALHQKYVNLYGTSICAEILKPHLGFEMDFLQPELMEKFEARGGHTRLCPTVVGLAAAWTVDLLWDELHKDPDLSGIPDLKEAEGLIASVKAENESG